MGAKRIVSENDGVFTFLVSIWTKKWSHAATKSYGSCPLLGIDELIDGRDEMIGGCQFALEEGSLEKRVRSSSPNLSLNSRKQASHRVSWRKADHVWLNRMENPLAQKRKSSLPIHRAFQQFQFRHVSFDLAVIDVPS